MGKLDVARAQAKKNDWVVVDMKNDWQVIYPFESDAPHGGGGGEAPGEG